MLCHKILIMKTNRNHYFRGLHYDLVCPPWLSLLYRLLSAAFGFPGLIINPVLVCNSARIFLLFNVLPIRKCILPDSPVINAARCCTLSSSDKYYRPRQSYQKPNFIEFSSEFANAFKCALGFSIQKQCRKHRNI